MQGVCECVCVCVCVCMHACWEQTTKKKEEGLNISASVLSHVQLDSLQLYGLQLLCHGFSATARLFCSCDSLGKNTGMGCHFLLLEIFPIQGSNLCFLHLPVFAGGFSTTEPPRKPLVLNTQIFTQYRKRLGFEPDFPFCY